MKISVKTGKIYNLQTHLLAVFLFDESRDIENWLKDLDELTGKRLSEVFKTGDFRAKLNETLIIYAPEKSSIRRVMIVGMGKRREFDLEKVRQVFGTASKQARDKKIKRFTLCLTGIDTRELNKKEIAHAAAESAVLSLYRFTKFKTEDIKQYTSVNEIILYDVRRTHFDEFRTGAEEGRLFAEATCYARDLASYPGNVVTPAYLSDEAKSIAGNNGLKCTILDEKKLRSLNMNALLGVAQGSKNPARLIILEYDCGIKKADTVALVGKGITFDSGGISLKPSKKMEEMKYDMCGGAAVLGIMNYIKRLQPHVNVVGVVASAENLPSGNAVKPGDILKAYSGLTIEVINTDAEGRLVLSDALAYTVDKYKPYAMIDLATLTGAVVVALGHYATGMLGNNAGVMNKITAASRRSGEIVWELPIYPEFDEHLKSDIADIKNSDGPGAGVIFGAAFLKKFVGKTPWVHLDIAGTAWDVKEKSYLPKGPTGVGVRLLARFLKDWK